jgi:hypothetical protein
MAFRQLKAPAIANEAVINTKLAPSALSGQSSALSIDSLSNDTLLVHTASSGALSKISVSNLVDSLDTDNLSEGATNLYYTDARAQTAVSSDISSAVAAEALIARAAEDANEILINNEVTRAGLAEGVNATAITTEETRATGIEAGIVTAYEAADTSLQTQITNILTNVDPGSLDSLTEIVTAFQDADDIFTAAFTTTNTNVSNETSARIAADLTLTTNLGLTQAELDASQVGAGLTAAGAYIVGASTNYLTTATSLNDADIKLDIQAKLNATNLTAEITRAGLAEVANADNIATNVTNIATNVTDISDEVTRAGLAESALSGDIASEITARGNADTSIRTDFAAADTLQTTALQTYADTAETDAIATAATDATNKDNAQSTVLTSAYVAADGVVTTAYEAADTVLSGRADTLETEMDTAEGRLDDLEANTGGGGSLDTVAQTISGAINEMHTDTNAVEGRVTTAEADIVTNATGIANIISNTDAGALDSLTELLAEFQSADSTLTGLINTNATAITTEQTRATGVEATNASAIVTEAGIARAAEGVNAGAVVTEAGTRSTADTTLQTNIDAEATTRGNADTALQTELDDTQAGAGLNTDGTYTANGTATYISTATTLQDADNKLDVQAKVNADAIAAEVTRAGNAEVANANNIATNVTNIATNVTDIAQEITDRGTADSTLQGGINDVQAELDTTQAGAGLSATGSYAQNTSANYIAAATTLNDADVKLDIALKTEADRAIAAEGTNATAISTEETRATNAESAIDTKIDNEVTRSTSADSTHTTNIGTNATNIGTNASAISTEAASRISADDTLTTNLGNEVTRAGLAEDANTDLINATQTGAGLSTAGAYVAPTGSNYHDTANSLANADIKLDTAIKAEVDRALAAEGVNAGEITAIQTGVGLSAAGAYVAPTGSNYHDTAISFANADIKLDDAIKAEKDRAELAEATLTTNVSTNATDIANILTNVDPGALDSLTEIVSAFELADSNINGAISSLASTASTDRALIRTEFAAADTSLQNELDATQTGAGLSTAGAYVSPTTSNYHDAATSLTSADMLIDAAIKTEADRALAAEGVNAGDIASEITRAGLAEDANTTEITTTQTGAGLSATGTYVAPTTSEYHDTAISLANADMKLDAAIKAEYDRAYGEEFTLSGRVTTEEGNVDALQATMGSTTLNTTAQTVTAAINELDTASSGGLSGIQTDLDTAEAAIIVNATDIADEETRATNAEGALSTTIGNNDTQVRSDFASADLAIQQELDVTQAGAGLSVAGAYVAPTTSNYHDTATSLANADIKLDTAIKAEADRALLAEGNNTTAIGNEVTRAGLAEDANTTAIGNEVSRATGVESAQATDIAANLTEITTTQAGAGLSTTGTYVAPTTSNYHNTATSLANADMKLDAALKAEYDRALLAEGNNTTAISDEVTRAGIAEGVNATAISDEQSRATTAEGTNASSISTVSGNLATEVTDRGDADQLIQDELNDTQTGAGLSATGTYVAPTTSNYHDAATTLTSADMLLDSAIKAEADRALAAEGVNAGEITAIQTGVGLSAAGAYVAPTTSNYHDAAISFTNADMLLDAAIKTEADRALAAEGILTTNVQTNTDDIANIISNIDGAALDSLTEIVAAFEGADSTINGAITSLAGTASTDRALIRTEFADADQLIQDELDATQAAAGLSTAGAYVAPTTSNYHDAATTLTSADMLLDAAIKAEYDRAVGVEGTNTTNISNNLTEITATQAGAGLSTTGDYIAPSGSNYHDAATSLASADIKLDIALKDEVDRALLAEGTNNTAIGTETSRALLAEGLNTDAIDDEETRALAAESTLTTTKLAKSGDDMTGVLAMGNNKITLLATPTVTTDAANKSYVDGVASAQHISGKTTDDLTEGSTNQYYTDTRAQAAISVVDTEGTGRVSYSAGVVTVDTQKSFLELTDYVGSGTYASNANYVAVVNPAGTGMVLVDPTGLLVSDIQRQTLNGDGVTTVFALTFDVGAAEDLMVFVGGVIQDPSVHYTVNAGANSIDFTGGAIPTGTQAVIVGHQTGYTVQSGAVTESKLASNIKPFILSDNVSATTGGDIIDTFVAADYRTAKYVIQVSDATNTEYESREALVIHDGTNAYITEFAMIYTGAALIGNASVAMNGANVELTYTTTSVTATVKVISTYIAV